MSLTLSATMHKHLGPVDTLGIAQILSDFRDRQEYFLKAYCRMARKIYAAWREKRQKMGG